MNIRKSILAKKPINDDLEFMMSLSVVSNKSLVPDNDAEISTSRLSKSELDLRGPLEKKKKVPPRWTKLCTGSTYFGEWDQFGINGPGLFRFSDGLLFDGTLKNGHFHGHGTLSYPNGVSINGTWKKGVNVKRQLVFRDGLKFEEKDWDYCQHPDRRYAMDEMKEIPPIGRHSVFHKQSYDNIAKIPYGYYLTGKGCYNPATKCLCSLNDPNEIIRIPTVAEEAWILENCARSWIEYSKSENKLLETTDYEQTVYGLRADEVAKQNIRNV